MYLYKLNILNTILFYFDASYYHSEEPLLIADFVISSCYVSKVKKKMLLFGFVHACLVAGINRFLGQNREETEGIYQRHHLCALTHSPTYFKNWTVHIHSLINTSWHGVTKINRHLEERRSIKNTTKMHIRILVQYLVAYDACL